MAIFVHGKRLSAKGFAAHDVFAAGPIRCERWTGRGPGTAPMK
ncbi:hypothetical protein [Paracoccus sp. S1E-3]|nr:hypothetical protein [Paracoccus sp. S1E-3]